MSYRWFHDWLIQLTYRTDSDAVARQRGGLPDGSIKPDDWFSLEGYY